MTSYNESVGKVLKHFLIQLPHTLPPLSTSKQEPALLFYEESTLTPHCQQEPISTPPPSSNLLYSALSSLALSFSAESQIGGWGMFCGPNKRAKVVRTSLNESVGGWGKMVGVGGSGGQ